CEKEEAQQEVETVCVHARAQLFHFTPAPRTFFAYSRLRSRSVRCCSLSASAIVGLCFPGPPITMRPKYGCPLLARAMKLAKSAAGVFGNTFQKSGSKYGSTVGGRPVIISSCIAAFGHSF